MRGPALLLALLCTACGERQSAPPSPSSAWFEPRTTSPELSALREVRVLARVSPADFEFESGVVEDGRWHPAGADPVIFKIPCQLELSEVQRVAFALVAPEDLRWQAALLSGGRAVVVLPVNDARQAEGGLVVDVPAQADGPVDELVVSFARPTQELSLGEVSFLQQSVAARVPAPGDGVVEVTSDLTMRRAAGLFASAPLRGGVQLAGEGETFSLHLACPGAHAARVRVELSAAGVQQHQEFEVPPGGAWTAVNMELASLAAGELHLELSLLEGDPCAVSVPVVFKREPTAPLVLLITSDTHRGDHMGHVELGVEVETPTLDALAARGVSFVEARSATNITNPSHIALLTGVHPFEHGIVDNVTPLAERAQTLAEVFAAAGWRTAAVVSASHLSPERSGLGQGFEVFAAPPVNGAEGFDAVSRLQQLLPELAGRPTFLWLHLFDAHAPYRPPARWLERYTASGRDPYDETLPEPPRRIPWARGVRDLSYLVNLYRGEVSSLDERLAALLERPELAGAWIAFTSDHGEHLGVDNGVFDHQTLELGNVHVPLVVAGPGVPCGVRSEAVVSNLDLGRTLLDLAGEWQADFPGHNLLASEEPAGDARFAYSRYGQAVSVEREGWLLIRQLLDQGASGQAAGEEQLFDLKHDRACQHDLLAEEPQRARALRAQLDEFLTETRPRHWASEREPSASELLELEALGYAGAEEE